ncbi:MAG TPA: ATP-grasp domain-containing protein [Planctomycetota bacterium]|nr:ATP-grasp domain-containing protein [Planctomycetota bacterium]
MRILFCRNPLEPTKPDEPYEGEAAAANALGIPWSLIDFEALVNDRDAERAVRRVRDVEPGLCLYRGWMLRPEAYARLFDVLARRGLRLLNDPAAYRHAHYLPESYAEIAPVTPRSVWIPSGAEPPMPEIRERLREFGKRPLVLKDYVKSQKHAWAEACFIPDASDTTAVERVVRRFLELQGPELNEGLVFREFVELERIGTHPRSGLPLFREHRVFFLDREPVFTCRYWDEAAYGEGAAPVDRFREVARRVRSRFFSMDIARKTNGEWIVVELGDGQVAGLPDNADRSIFLEAIKRRWPAV